MSLHFLKFGLNINNKQKETHKEEQEQVLMKATFPNCSEYKKTILKIKRKIELLKKSNDIEKLKEKKLLMLVDLLQEKKQELLNKLAINSETEIDPLCSFEEIQK
jgi:hypothetical protein